MGGKGCGCLQSGREGGECVSHRRCACSVWRVRGWEMVEGKGRKRIPAFSSSRQVVRERGRRKGGISSRRVGVRSTWRGHGWECAPALGGGDCLDVPIPNRGESHESPIHGGSGSEWLGGGGWVVRWGEDVMGGGVWLGVGVERCSRVGDLGGRVHKGSKGGSGVAIWARVAYG